MRRSTIIGAVLVGGLALAGCTPNEEPSDQPPAPGTPPPATAQQHAGQHPTGSTGEHAEADREFAQELLANRQQVLELAGLAESNAASAEVKALATELQQATQPRVDQLSTFLGSAAGQSSGPPEDAGDDDSGLQTPQQMQQLQQLSGAQFDQQWKQAMLSLQQSAGQLARAEQQDGSAQEMRTLAEEFVAEEQATLDKLNALV
ncbi:DUF305 domain-containing protein [Saccharopolyspora sp. 5N708]|uniref:DUF305 domain-containing protein n=1 Tax=Saccharopolyspora sp. 5N708 TaxID=3457424 RepID=UPI003FCEEBDB